MSLSRKPIPLQASFISCVRSCAHGVALSALPTARTRNSIALRLILFPRGHQHAATRDTILPMWGSATEVKENYATSEYGAALVVWDASSYPFGCRFRGSKVMELNRPVGRRALNQAEALVCAMKRRTC